jgi:hypothetical protein
MITFKEIMSEQIDLYRGVNPKYGDVNHGIQSIGDKHKLVGSLGPNYTDSIEVARRYGKQIVKKTISSSRILELPDYDDIIRLYKKYETQITPGLASNIKYSYGDEKYAYIKQAGKELRDILKKKYDAIKVPLNKGDTAYLASKGLSGKMYIILN